MAFDVHCRRPFSLPRDIDLEVARWTRSSRPILRVATYDQDDKGNLHIPSEDTSTLMVPRGNYHAITAVVE